MSEHPAFSFHIHTQQCQQLLLISNHFLALLLWVRLQQVAQALKGDVRRGGPSQTDPSLQAGLSRQAGSSQQAASPHQEGPGIPILGAAREPYLPFHMPVRVTVPIYWPATKAARGIRAKIGRGTCCYGYHPPWGSISAI